MPARLVPVACAVLLVVGLLPGCGGGTTGVRGKVTHGGKTVVWGSVTLIDGKGMVHQGEIGLDGTYSIENVPTGSVKIGVYSPKPEEDQGKDQRGGPKLTGGKAGSEPDDPRAKYKQATPDRPKPPPGAWFPIPEKYTDPLNSGLTGEVKRGAELIVDVK